MFISYDIQAFYHGTIHGTITEKERRLPASLYAPVKLDVAQWIGVARDARVGRLGDSRWPSVARLIESSSTWINLTFNLDQSREARQGGNASAAHQSVREGCGTIPVWDSRRIASTWRRSSAPRRSNGSAM
jgi:hypothetical protein